MADPDYDALAKQHGGTIIEPHISAARQETALPAGIEGQRAELWRGLGGDPLSAQAREMLTKPLMHPTGVDTIDSFTSPINLALTAVMGAKPAADALTGAMEGLTSKIGGKLTAKILKFVMPSLLKKPAELADIMTELGKLGEKAPGEAPVTPQAAPAAAPVSAPPVASVAPPAVATAGPAADFNMGQSMNDVRGVFRKIGVTPGPAEVNNAASMMKFGKTAESAVVRVLEQRPGVDLKAAAKLAEKLGTPSEATVLSRVAARNSTGRWDN